MAVDDEFSVLCLGHQELVSDIQKIIAILTVEGYARPYSGVTEEIIADRRRGLESFQELTMVLRETRLEGVLNSFEIASGQARARRNSVGMQGFEPTEAAPNFQNPLVFEEAQQKVLVMANATVEVGHSPRERRSSTGIEPKPRST